MTTSIEDGLIARKPQWGDATRSSTTPDDVAGTLTVMFTLDLDRGATVAMDFDFDAIAGAETGIIVVEKTVAGTTYIRIKQFSYDSTGITDTDGYAAGANAIRGISHVEGANEDVTVRARVSQTGGTARAINHAYAVSQGLS